MVCFFYRNHRLVDGAFALLNPLSHGMQVGREVYGGGEDTFVFFAFGLAVKLFPPFAHVVQLGVEVYENFNLFTVPVELVAGSGIDGGRVLGKRNIFAASLFHDCCTGHQLVDVETCHCDGQQAYRSQYREAAAYVVGDDEGFITFVVGRYTGCAFLGVCDGYDYFLCHVLAALVFALLLQEAESQGCFGGGS